MFKLAVALAIVACSSPPAPAPAPAPAPVVDHHLHSTSIDEVGAVRVVITGDAVPLEELPVAEWIGLPMTGQADIAIDIRIPVDHGQRDDRGATGQLSVRCTRCTLGDDRTPLRPSHPSAFGGEIQFGHIGFDRIDIAAVIADGHAKVTRWSVTSPDVAIDVALQIDLARDLADSATAGCIRFKPTPALQARDPKLAALLELTGAPLARDGMFDIRLAGTVGDMKRLGQVCDGSTVPTVASRPELPTATTAPTAPDTVTPESADEIARAITRKDDTTYDVDAAFLAKAAANPTAIARGARVVPAVEDGKAAGFKLYAIRPASLFARLGFLNGDTLRSIDGIAVDSADRALEIFSTVSKARRGDSVTVTIDRRGTSLTLTYHVR